MNQLDAAPAPVIPVPKRDKWRTEQAAFRHQLSALLKSYRDQFVAIHEGKVVESGPDKLAVAGRAYARFGYIPIYVSKVTDEPQPVSRVPSARPARQESAV
jgi:hypothetical protein